MQDKIILGLLLDQPHTSYSIKKTMEKSVDFFYGTSLGSIHPCLKKLADKKLCNTKEILSGKRKSLEYSITKKGEAEFQSWLSSTLEMGRVKDDSLVKLFFLGHLSNNEILKVADEYINEIDQALNGLKIIDQNNQQAILQAKKNGIELTQIQNMRLETLRFGMDYMKFARQWYVDFKKRV